jgi:plasmid stabilization system protein ParE
MNAVQIMGFALHPLAAQDISEIWETIAEDNPSAARRVREEILRTIRGLAPFPKQGHKRPDLTGRRGFRRGCAVSLLNGSGGTAQEEDNGQSVGLSA